MKIKIIITHDELESKHEVEVPKCQAHELAILFEILRAKDTHTLASMIPGIISIGSDVMFQRYIKKNLKGHEDSFDELWKLSQQYKFKKGLSD